MDLDLNQEPLQHDSFPEGSPERLFVEMGDHHERVVERIRLLESVVARTRFRAAPIPSSDVAVKVPKPQLQFGSIKPGKIDLVAEALAMDSTCEETLPSTSASPSTIQWKPGGSIYDCNICFSLSKDPVLTCCGHLFCWPCFYCLPSTDSYSSKECPVCEGEVLETDITPIYGAAAASSPTTHVPSTFNSLQPVKIPHRPRARRIETVRQRLGYPPLPPNQRANLMFPHPTLPATHYTTPPRSRTTSLRQQQQPRNLFPGAPLGDTIADHMAFFINMQQLPRTQAQPLEFHAVADMDDGAPIFPNLGPVVETNPAAPFPPQSQTGTSDGNPVTDGIHDSNETVVSGHSSSRRRASNDVGLTVRGRRRRRRG